MSWLTYDEVKRQWYCYGMGVWRAHERSFQFGKHAIKAGRYRADQLRPNYRRKPLPNSFRYVVSQTLRTHS